MQRFLNQEETEIARKAGFNDMGLRYEVCELMRVDRRGKSLSEMARYVDAVTFVKTRAGDKAFLVSLLRPMQDARSISFNTTSLGNLAYIAIHFPDEEVRARAEELFVKLLEV